MVRIDGECRGSDEAKWGAEFHYIVGHALVLRLHGTIILGVSTTVLGGPMEAHGAP